MPIVTIDPQRCKKDGLCVRICEKVFAQAVEGSPPVVVHEENCNSCGHCVLVCPAGAITQTDCPPEKVHPVRKEILPSYESMREMVVARRSIRTFKKKDVEKEMIERIIDAARFAPSAKNTQSTQFIVVQDKPLLQTLASATAEWLGKIAKQLKNPLMRKLYLLRGEKNAEEVTQWISQFELIVKRMRSGSDPILFNAPALVLFHADQSASFAEANANLAVQNATLIASSLGLGTFYTGYLVAACTRDKAARRLLKLPRNHKAYGGLALGYPEITFSKWVERNPAIITWM
ncbi:MAG: Ferredoxin-1 [Syntrophorhabdus sp. PtaU1.Bin002]|nr:MAG: Ferredoxin-1 [Syntrophorhabdus sp. PtaB.Bin006]OPY67131.1 MAG: Ferredoxin-1 [Syntrophorhabdus sp. PtaU1.Bin002]